MVVGHPLREGVHIGAVADARQMQQNLNYIEIAKKEGGKLVSGGDVITEETEGYYLTPALFTETTNDMTIKREEAFAPIACVISFGSREMRSYAKEFYTIVITTYIRS